MRSPASAVSSISSRLPCVGTRSAINPSPSSSTRNSSTLVADAGVTAPRAPASSSQGRREKSMTLYTGPRVAIEKSASAL
jgi:hypothetical protein